MNGLAAWAKVVVAMNCGYAWGAQGEILTYDILDKLLSTYSIDRYYFGNYSVEKWINRRCFDCSGLVVWIMQRLNVIDKKQDFTAQGLKEKADIIKKEELQQGDIMFVNGKSGKANHIGIYLGEESFVHARSTKNGVVKNTFKDYPHWNEYGRFKMEIPNIHWSEPVFSMLQEAGCKFDNNKQDELPTWAQLYSALFKFATAFDLIK